MIHSRPQLVIRVGESECQYWQELWRYRELFYFLAWRDILVRYEQKAIGIAWALLRPFLTMVVFTVVFGSIAKLPSNTVLSMAVVLALFCSGIWYFRKMERTFADVIELEKL